MDEFLGQWSAEQSLGTEETAPREPGCQGSTCLEIPEDFSISTNYSLLNSTQQSLHMVGNSCNDVPITPTLLKEGGLQSNSYKWTWGQGT